MNTNLLKFNNTDSRNVQEQDKHVSKKRSRNSRRNSRNEPLKMTYDCNNLLKLTFGSEHKKKIN